MNARKAAVRRRRRPGCLGRLVRLALVVTVLAALALGGAAYVAWTEIHTPRPLPPEGVTLEIPSGTSVRGILRRLEDAGVIGDARLAFVYLRAVRRDPTLRAGEYRFEGAPTLPTVVDRLIAGSNVSYPLTLIEGLTLEEAADAIVAAGFGAREVLLAEMRDPSRIADLDPDAITLEGYLHPDTYHLARGTTEAQLVDLLVDTFRRRWQREIAPLLPATPVENRVVGGVPRYVVPEGLSVRKLVTLASVVEKEALLDEERPVIAGVYANRLRRGIGLYADPTVIYALKRRGTWDGNIRKPDLRVDDPYNTYVYPGLPPGPIASPGLASLLAAAGPADVPYLYFVSRNDGTHVFAETLREHNRNVDEWQRRYWRRKRAAEGAQR
ncbi:MAG: endolytic transglycosylase MltG [Acidobacteriota bacterium]